MTTKEKRNVDALDTATISDDYARCLECETEPVDLDTNDLYCADCMASA